MAKPISRRAWWLIGAAGAIVVLAGLLWAAAFWYPSWQYPPLAANETREHKDARLKLQNDARTTMVQGVGALLVLGGAGIGATVTLRQVRATRAQITETATASANQLKLSEQGQFTDRYTKAIDQLDDKNAPAVRLGGLYALERIARDSPYDRATIAEVLCSYVRTARRAAPPSRSGKAAEPPETDASPAERSSAASLSSLEYRAPDVQAALTILGRWRGRLDHPPPVLDLHGAEIQGADLHGLRLDDAILHGAQLQGANLRSAWLWSANLRGAQLQGADLLGARARDTILHGAELQGANLSVADLERANFHSAQLQDAKLNEAELQGADLTEAQLQRANLRGAQLWGADLRGADLADADLSGADLHDATLARAANRLNANLAPAQLQRADLTEAKLQRADLRGADLKGADLRHAQLQGAYLDDAQLQGAKASRDTRWPDGWDQARIAAAGVRFIDAEREAGVRSTGDVAQGGAEQDSSGR